MNKTLLLILFSYYSIQVFSQNLAAFNDYRKHFMVFDNGQVKELEHLPVQSYQLGGVCIPYVSNSGQFKVYHNGNVKLLSERKVSSYIATRCLLVYFLYDQLYVFDNGNGQLLSSNVKNYAVGDSLVAFYNENTNSSHVYYKGEIIDIERSLVGNPITEFKAGDNLFGYFNDNTNYLKVFYNGELYDVLQTSAPVRFEAGRSIVAYIDNSLNSFHAFYKGDVVDLEDFEPKSFKVGDDVLAYVDNLGEFKVFTNGELRTISSFEPDMYDIKDSLVVFSEQEYLKVFYNGEIYELENYIPAKFQMQQSSIAFVGLNGWLKAFINGKYITVTKDLLNSFVLSYNLIYMNTTGNTVKVYSNGKLHNTN